MLSRLFLKFVFDEIVSLLSLESFLKGILMSTMYLSCHLLDCSLLGNIQTVH